MRLPAVLQCFKTDWRLLGPLLLVNALGMAFGWYYYADVGQFDLDHLACGDGATEHCQPWWTWPLVADSPNAVGLFFLAVLAYRYSGWRSKWLDAYAFLLNVYVGLWTTFLFVAYADQMGTYDWAGVPSGNANPVLFIAHMGMPLQAFVLAHDLRRDPWGPGPVLAVLATLAAYIWVDYWAPLLLHPAPFVHPDDGLLHAGSPWLMVAAAAAWLVVLKWPRTPDPPFDVPTAP